MAVREGTEAKILIFFFFSAVTALIIAAPLAVPGGSIPRLDGTPGIVDHPEILVTLDAPWNLVYYFGDIWCHQRADRSLSLNGNQLPLCIRCFGIFLGIPLGCLISLLWAVPITPALHRKVIIVLLIGSLPIVMDGGGQLLGFWESLPAIRALTGILAGAGGGLILGILVDVMDWARQPSS
jgi:uncharacterized membrane protein